MTVFNKALLWTFEKFDWMIWFLQVEDNGNVLPNARLKNLKICTKQLIKMKSELVNEIDSIKVSLVEVFACIQDIKTKYVQLTNPRFVLFYTNSYFQVSICTWTNLINFTLWNVSKTCEFEITYSYIIFWGFILDFFIVLTRLFQLPNITWCSRFRSGQCNESKKCWK